MTVQRDTLSKAKPKLLWLTMGITLTLKLIPMVPGEILLTYMKFHFWLGFQDNLTHQTILGELQKPLWMMKVFPNIVFGNPRMLMMLGILKEIQILWGYYSMLKMTLVGGSQTVFQENCPGISLRIPINGVWIMNKKNYT